MGSGTAHEGSSKRPSTRDRQQETVNKRPSTRDRQQETVNKSLEVRKYLARHPDARPSEIVRALAPIEISAGFVANIKSKFKRNQMPEAAAAGPSGDVQADQLIAAAELLRRSGNIGRARAALELAHKVATTAR